MGIFQSMSPFIEICIITIFINFLLSFFWNTRSMDLMLGVVAFLLIFATTTWLPLPVLHKLMYLVVNVAVIAIIVIFQPELRVALSKLSLKGKRHREITEFDKFLDQLANSTYKMAEKQVGALIVLEKDNSLEEYAKKAVLLYANFSSELLESLFSRYAPLHDGAVIIRDKTIVAASAILPLADAPHVQKTLGTRHRAAIGLTLTTDAIVIVVSEETGKVSLARDGIITRGIKMDRFKGIIRSLLGKDQDEQTYKKKFNFWEWVKQ
jgi:diadenylate cyclase